MYELQYLLNATLKGCIGASLYDYFKITILKLQWHYNQIRIMYSQSISFLGRRPLPRWHDVKIQVFLNLLRHKIVSSPIWKKNSIVHKIVTIDLNVNLMHLIDLCRYSQNWNMKTNKFDSCVSISLAWNIVLKYLQ